MIRLLGPGDAATWRAIRLEALGSAPKAFTAAYDDWASRPLDDFAAQIANAPIFVFEANGAAVGCITWTRDRDPARKDRGWIESVFVREKSRGRGVGDALVGAALDHASLLGLSEMMLEVGSENGVAQALYARAGFERIALAPTQRSHPDRCEITMRAGLRPAGA